MINNKNFLNIYLGKSNLIESSAGTGKTHILSLLYLRFLLGINIEYNFLNLFIKNILVVTFTDVACLEIKKRIFSNIRKLRTYFFKKINIDDYIKNIFLYIKNIPNILNILINCENNIDTISIYTIHGFCKKILFSYFINSNINFYSKILNYEDKFIYNIIILFWRKYFYNLSFNIIKIIYSYWINPMCLYKYIYCILNFTNFKFNSILKYFSIEDCYNKIINYINDFKKKWILNYKYIYKYINSLKFNFFLYNKKKIEIWFNYINLWCKNKNIDFYIPFCLKNFSYKYISKYIFFLDFNIKNIFIYIDKLYFIINDLRNFIIFKCLEYINIKKNIYKERNNFISFNDLINKLNYILNNYENNFLLNDIRNNYPICLIDEFQDTDILQFNIFNNIYIKNKFNNTKIIFIGDPKQCIYTFRNANIFNYFKVKNNVDFLYILNINWRSSYFLVKSINYIFNKIKNIFIFKDLNYISVLPSYKNKFLFIKKNKLIDFSIKFFNLNNFNNLNYKINIAKFCSIKIYNLLNSKKYFLYKNNIKRKILPSDIAILVHKNYEIKIFFDILKKYFLPINCILEKSNIFSSLEAKEIFFVLKAIIFPEHKLNIKNALFTNIFNYDLFTINKYINNYKLYINIINNFYYYNNIWDKYGIYSLINFLLENKNINNNNNFVNYKNEQFNINLLHIAEILQKKFCLINDKFLLLNWLNEKINNLSDINNKEYYLRSFSYENEGIKISTIHKSKGLQYNIVWIPFLFFLNKFNNFNIYYNRKNCKINIDLFNLKKNNNFMNEEIISEEMRLLYVAITRSIYQCNIILYKIFNKNKNFNCINRIINNNKNLIFFNYKYINFININIFKYIKKNNFYIIKYILQKNNNLKIKKKKKN